MIEALSEAQLRRRRQRLVAILHKLGDLAIEDSGEGPVRVSKFLLTAPGHGLPPEAVFDYSERFEHGRSEWRLVRYEYEYRESPGPGRLAYHWHDGVFHAHCVEAGRSPTEHHYRSYAVTIYEAHEEFAGQFSRGEAVTCGHLRPAILGGTVRRYDDPTASVAEEDWEAST